MSNHQRDPMELVPMWKIYGFTQKNGCKVKEEMDLNKKMITLNVCVREHSQIKCPSHGKQMKTEKQWKHRLTQRIRSDSP